MIEPRFDKDGITLYCGDCLDVMPQLEAGSIDFAVTSPPYFNARPEYSEWESYQDYLDFMKVTIEKTYDSLKPSGRIAINIPDGYSRNPWLPIYADFCKILQSAQYILRGSIVWNKSNGAGKTSWGSWLSSSNPCLIDEHEMIVIAHKLLSGIDSDEIIPKKYFLSLIHSVWNIKAKPKNGHPAPYPIELPKRLITLLTGKNNIVLDPFMGSGTSGVAAVNLGRRFIGIEISEQYYAIAEKRIREAMLQIRMPI